MSRGVRLWIAAAAVLGLASYLLFVQPSLLSLAPEAAPQTPGWSSSEADEAPQVNSRADQDAGPVRVVVEDTFTIHGVLWRPGVEQPASEEPFELFTLAGRERVGLASGDSDTSGEIRIELPAGALRGKALGLAVGGRRYARLVHASPLRLEPSRPHIELGDVELVPGSPVRGTAIVNGGSTDDLRLTLSSELRQHGAWGVEPLQWALDRSGRFEKPWRVAVGRWHVSGNRNGTRLEVRDPAGAILNLFDSEPELTIEFEGGIPAGTSGELLVRTVDAHGDVTSQTFVGLAGHGGSFTKNGTCTLNIEGVEVDTRVFAYADQHFLGSAVTLGDLIRAGGVLALARTPHVTLSVVDGRSGDPVRRFGFRHLEGPESGRGSRAGAPRGLLEPAIDNEGRTRVHFLPGRHVLDVESEGYGGRIVTLTIDAVAECARTIELSPVESVSVRIVGPDGAPMTDVEIALVELTTGARLDATTRLMQPGTWWSQEALEMFKIPSGGYVRGATRTGPDGGARFSAPSDTGWWLAITRAGFEPCFERLADAVLMPHRAVRLTPSPR